MNSREKGKRGERQWRDVLRAEGFQARRGQQFAGSPDSPDVVCEELKWIHFEVKCVERLNIEDAMEQARRDAAVKIPVVAHRRSHRTWLVTMDAESFFGILRGDHIPGNATAEQLAEISRILKSKSVGPGVPRSGRRRRDENPENVAQPGAADASGTRENQEPGGIGHEGAGGAVDGELRVES